MLILGEPGSGRSTLARALHGASPRAAGPLVEVDPGAIPSTLFESEFFGYRAGAFTGAEQAERGAGGARRRGDARARPRRGAAARRRSRSCCAWWRSAATRPWAARRPGPTSASSPSAPRTSPGASPARPSAPTSSTAWRCSPSACRRCASGARTCRRILDHLLADLGERFGVRAPTLAPRARAWMLEHPWPGNLRQLRNILERGLVILGRGRRAGRSAASPRGCSNRAPGRSSRWRRSRSATPSPTPAATRARRRSCWASAARRCGRSGGGMESRLDCIGSTFQILDFGLRVGGEGGSPSRRSSHDSHAPTCSSRSLISIPSAAGT